jgi:hypothetical protein
MPKCKKDSEYAIKDINDVRNDIEDVKLDAKM